MENAGLVSPNLVTFLLTIVNIGVLFVILRAILFKPVSKFMAERTKRSTDNIEQAERDKNQAKLLLQQYEAQLKNAELEADAIIRAARDTAEEEAGRIGAEGRKQAENLLAEGRKQVEAERLAALALFRTEAAALVVAAAERLIRRELTADDKGRYAGLLLKELGKNQGA
jgi:F-type H+-transporting ATPase subunit b